MAVKLPSAADFGANLAQGRRRTVDGYDVGDIGVAGRALAAGSTAMGRGFNQLSTGLESAGKKMEVAAKKAEAAAKKRGGGGGGGGGRGGAKGRRGSGTTAARSIYIQFDDDKHDDATAFAERMRQSKDEDVTQEGYKEAEMKVHNDGWSKRWKGNLDEEGGREGYGNTDATNDYQKNGMDNQLRDLQKKRENAIDERIRIAHSNRNNAELFERLDTTDRDRVVIDGEDSNELAQGRLAQVEENPNYVEKDRVIARRRIVNTMADAELERRGYKEAKKILTSKKRDRGDEPEYFKDITEPDRRALLVEAEKRKKKLGIDTDKNLDGLATNLAQGNLNVDLDAASKDVEYGMASEKPALNQKAVLVNAYIDFNKDLRYKKPWEQRAAVEAEYAKAKLKPGGATTAETARRTHLLELSAEWEKASEADPIGHARMLGEEVTEVAIGDPTNHVRTLTERRDQGILIAEEKGKPRRFFQQTDAMRYMDMYAKGDYSFVRDFKTVFGADTDLALQEIALLSGKPEAIAMLAIAELDSHDGSAELVEEVKHGQSIINKAKGKKTAMMLDRSKTALPLLNNAVTAALLDVPHLPIENEAIGQLVFQALESKLNRGTAKGTNGIDSIPDIVQGIYGRRKDVRGNIWGGIYSQEMTPLAQQYLPQYSPSSAKQTVIPSDMIATEFWKLPAAMTGDLLHRLTGGRPFGVVDGKRVNASDEAIQGAYWEPAGKGKYFLVAEGGGKMRTGTGNEFFVVDTTHYAFRNYIGSELPELYGKKSTHSWGSDLVDRVSDIWVKE